MIAVILITGDDDEDNPSTVADTVSTIDTIATETTPTIDTAPPEISTVPTTPVVPPTTQPSGGSVSDCEPVIGNGQPYPVSSAGSPPADCTQAHNVALTALANNQTRVGGWSCTIDLEAAKVLVCKKGGQTVVSRAP